MKTFAAVAFGTVLALAVGCSRDDAPRRQAAEEGVFEPIRITEAYITLLEKPDSARALFIGDEAKNLMPYFSNAGVRTFTQPTGRFDVVVLSCTEMSKASCAKAKAFLSESGVMAWLMDVRGVSARDFRDRLKSFDFAETHVWMPGETRWMVVGRATPKRVKLAAVMELFTREGTEADLAKAGFGAVPEIFANYVGWREEILPAFSSGRLDAEVFPEYFLSKEIPIVDWIVGDGVEREVVDVVAADIRSMQVIRRLIVQGNMLSAKATDKKGEDAAIDCWSRAAKRNPRDLFLQARLDRLAKSARAFLEAKKVVQAMKCYETMILIKATPDAINNFGMCLRLIGKKDLSEQVLRRAQELMRQAEKQL